MSDRTRAALLRLGRLLLLAAIPVVLEALQAGAYNWRVTGVAVAVAVLGALAKWLAWTEPDPEPPLAIGSAGMAVLSNVRPISGEHAP